MKKSIIFTVVIIAIIVIYQYGFNSSSYSEAAPLHVELNLGKTHEQDIQTQQKFMSENPTQSCLPETEFLQQANNLQQKYSVTVKQLQAAFTELPRNSEDSKFTLRNGTSKSIYPESDLHYAFLKFHHGGSLDDLKSTLKKTKTPTDGDFSGYALISAIMLKQQLHVNDILELLKLGLTVQFEDLVHATLTFQETATLQILRDNFGGDITTEWRRHGYHYNLSLISAESVNLAALEFWNSLGVKNHIAGEAYTALDLVPFPTQHHETTSVAAIVDYLVRAGVKPQQQITYIRLANWLTINADNVDLPSALSNELTQKLNGLVQQQTEAYQQLLSHSENYMNCYPQSEQPLQFEQVGGVEISENRYVDEINARRELLRKSAETAVENEVTIELFKAVATQDVDRIMQLLNENNDKPAHQLERMAIGLLLAEETDPDKMHQLLSKSPIPVQFLMFSVYNEDLDTLKKLGRYQLEVDPNDKDGENLIATAKESTTSTEIIEYLELRLTNMEY